jgi:hypothetical protein
LPCPIALSSSFSKKGDLSPQLNVGTIALLVTSVFAGKSDRPSCIPDAKGAIALLVSKGRSPFTAFSRAAGDRSF